MKHGEVAAGITMNPYGLYDMSGNVWEWVEDGYHGNYEGAPTDGSVWEGGTERMLRGGSWSDDPYYQRAENRFSNEALVRTNANGFRIARTLP